MRSYTHAHLGRYMDGEYHKFILGVRVSLVCGIGVVQFKDCRYEDGKYLTDHVGIKCRSYHIADWLFNDMLRGDEYEVECKVHTYNKGHMSDWVWEQGKDFGLTDLKSIKVKFLGGYVLYEIHEHSIEQTVYLDDTSREEHGSKVYHMYLHDKWEIIHDEQEYHDALSELKFSTFVKNLDDICNPMRYLAYSNGGQNHITQALLNESCPDRYESYLDRILERINEQLIDFKGKEDFIMNKYKQIAMYYNMLPDK